jgi:hypothetical protein
MKLLFIILLAVWYLISIGVLIWGLFTAEVEKGTELKGKTTNREL